MTAVNSVYLTPPLFSFKISGSYSRSVEEFADAQRDVEGVYPFEPHPLPLEDFSAAGGSTVQIGGVPVPLWTVPFPMLLPPRGLLVPQRKYKIKANGKRGFNAEPSIRFSVGNESGMSLQDAMDEKFEGLVGRDDGVFLGCDSTAISLRIEVHTVPMFI